MREITKVIVHCSDTPPSMDIGVREIRVWHVKENKWDDIGYHFVIRRNGIVEEGRPLAVQGAHAYGYNPESIGICMVGGSEGADFTFGQYSTLRTLVAALGIDDVCGHRDVDGNKDCPWFDVKAFLR